MKHVDPTIELSSAALADIDWNVNLLRNSSQFIDWISFHGYWDHVHETNDFCDYDTVMEKTVNLDAQVKKVRGLINAFGLENQIKIAFDEWNLREWYHPNVHTIKQGVTKEEHLYPRDKNDDNTKYTMADAVFSACFLNMCMRNCDIVKMANFSPAVNTRGCICTHENGIVLRSTYFVFALYTNYLGDIVLDSWETDSIIDAKSIPQIDSVVTHFSRNETYAIAVVNKSREEEREITLSLETTGNIEMHYICGSHADSYNDIDHTEIEIMHKNLGHYKKGMNVILKPHSVGVICINT